MSEIFETYIFNVGHGDNILIKFSTGTWGLIDFFYNSTQPEPPSLSHLKKLKGKIVIEFVHISHYHHDHTKGLEKFFQWVDENRDRVYLKRIWLPGMYPPQKLQKILNQLCGPVDIISLAKKNGSSLQLKSFEYHFTSLDEKIEEYTAKNKINALVNCQPFEVNEEYKTLCLSPSNETVNSINWNFVSYMGKIVQCLVTRQPYIDENTLSTILVFVRTLNAYADVKFTFGGDATLKDWRLALDKFRSVKSCLVEDLHTIYSSLIKVSHHGSRYSSSDDIWDDLISPQVKGGATHAFYSTGSQDYPNEETLTHIRNCASRKECQVENHSTNQKIKAQDYAVEIYDGGIGVSKAEMRAAGYAGSKDARKGDNFVGFKYRYDYEPGAAQVIALVKAM